MVMIAVFGCGERKDNNILLNLSNRLWKQAIIFLISSFLLRISSFGDTNIHIDETFYFLVGQRMHDGIVPYVDIWDRKPLGLFLIYYLIAGISRSVLAYQIVASLFAAATAMVINLITLRWAGRQGALLAGLAYLLMVGPFLGYGGQAPVFYNLFIATAALLLVQERERVSCGIVGWRVLGAMALCGMAITIKQTTLFESLFFGLYVVVSLIRAKTPPRRILSFAVCSCLIGSLPMLSIAGYYWAIGHWFEFWRAMVTSNLTKAAPPLNVIGWNIFFVSLRLLPILSVAVLGLASKENRSPIKIFIQLWTIVSLFGCIFIPNFVLHYFLPILVPLSVAAGYTFGRQYIGKYMFLTIFVCAIFWHNPFDRERSLQSIRSMDIMAQTIKEHDRGGGLLVFDGPPYLYAMTGKPFMTPLSFPYHLNFMNEKNVSHINTDSEIDRIVANKPESIVISVQPRNIPVNIYSLTKIRHYIYNHCHFVRVVTEYEALSEDKIAIYSNCN